MKKIIEIFKNDILKLSKSKIAMLIIIGIVFIPGIYAWLNIDSNWGPYDNTGNIPIAVVNKDEGVKIMNETVNMGNEITNALKKNNAMKWIFTDEKDAKANVKKSKYYGAIIIPKNFSENLTTIIDSSEPKKPTFDFYVNNKKNPIAPIIVNKAVGAIQNSVNETFINTIVYKIVDVAENINIVGKTSANTDNLIEELNKAKTDIGKVRVILKTTDSAANVTSKSLSALREILPTMNDITNTTKQGINDMKNAAKSFDTTYEQIEKDINSLISESQEDIKEISSIINKTNASNIQENHKEISNKLDKLLVSLKRLESTLTSVNSVANLSAINTLKDKISGQISKIENIQTLTKSADDTLNNLDAVKEKSKELNNDISKLKPTYQNTIKNDLSKLYKNASTSVSKATDVMLNLNVSLDGIDSSMKYMIEALESGGQLTQNLDVLLDGTINDIDKMIEVVKQAKQSEIFNNIVNLLKNNPDVIADFVTTPVETNQIDIYPIKTYGSEMSPFYSILACWVGCTILLAILKVDIKKSKITTNAKRYQKYFGRFMLFGTLAMLQGLVIGVGDLILQVQTVNWFLFLLTLMLSSLIFALIIYSLAVAFGKIGQALSIVIMVLQVAGSGGTFPIELLPRFFQVLQPFMPFYPAMNALRETIGGFYHYDYIIYILILLCHIIIPLILGLIFSKYTADIKVKLEKKLHATDVID